MVYKVYCDINSIDMNAFVEAAYKYGVDMCFGEECIYMHEDPHHLGSISNIMKETNNTNYYSKRVPNRPDKTPEDLVTVWIIEKMDYDTKIETEDEEQESMKKMLANIAKAKEVYLEMVEEAKKKLKNGGRGEDG